MSARKVARIVLVDELPYRPFRTVTTEDVWECPLCGEDDCEEHLGLVRDQGSGGWREAAKVVAARLRRLEEEK